MMLYKTEILIAGNPQSTKKSELRHGNDSLDNGGVGMGSDGDELGLIMYLNYFMEST